MAKPRRKSDPPRLLTDEEQSKVVEAMQLPDVKWDHNAACVKAGVRPKDGKHTFLNDESYKNRIGHLRSNILHTTALERAKARGAVARDLLQEQWLNWMLEHNGSMFEIMSHIDVSTERGRNQWIKAFECFNKIAFPSHVMHPKEDGENDQSIDGASLAVLQERLAKVTQKTFDIQRRIADANHKETYTKDQQHRDSFKHGPPIDAEESAGDREG